MTLNLPPLPSKTDLLYKQEVYQVVGAAMEVHRQLGCGFLEPVYQEALSFEFKSRGIPFVPQAELSIKYKDVILNKKYIADFIVFEKIIIELKAISELTATDEAQLLNYLRASGFQLGVLINFGATSLQSKRLIFTSKKDFS
jgi:GxxExxY protein